MPVDQVPDRDATFVARLTHNALIALSGDDAVAFAHGQFTSDVQGLSPGEAQWSGWCTAKGRLLATFLLVRLPERILLVLPSEITEPVRKRLGMFVLRSKVKLEVVPGLQALGLVGPAAADLVADRMGSNPESMRAAEKDGAVCVRLDGERFLFIAPEETLDGLRTGFTAKATEAGIEAWDAASIRAGIPTVVAVTQEAFVPQMVNLEVIGAVSFKKGCYPGQEIVARMHYRGGIKRRMALVHLAGESAPAPGDSLYSGAFGDQAAGQVANAAPSPGGGFDALVVAQIDSLAKGDLRWKSPDGPAVEFKPLPYEVVSP